MVSTVDVQELSWVIYNNLNEIIADPSTPAGDLENFTELKNGFLNNENFANTIRVAAEEAGVDLTAIEAQISAAQTAGPGLHADFAAHIIGQMDADRMPIVADLVEGYAPSADFTINNLRELQASEYSMPREAFEIEFTNLNPRFAEFFDHVNDSDGIIWDHDLVGQVNDALNGDPEALNTLIKVAGDEARMDALIEAVATEEAHDSFEYVLNAVEPPAPEQAPAATDAFVVAARIPDDHHPDSPVVEETSLYDSVAELAAANVEAAQNASTYTDPSEIDGIGLDGSTEVMAQLFNRHNGDYDALPATASEAITNAQEIFSTRFEEAEAEGLNGFEEASIYTASYLNARPLETRQTVLLETRNVELGRDITTGIEVITAEPGTEVEADVIANGAMQVETDAAIERDANLEAMSTGGDHHPPINPETLSREDIISGLREMRDSGNDWQLDSYRQGLVLLNPEYERVFEGIESQGGNVEQLLQGAFNNADSPVLEQFISYADDPAKLEALRVIVTNDNNPETFLADERQMEEFINGLARENGIDIHTAPDGSTNFEVTEDGQIVAEGVGTVNEVVENQLDIMIHAPEVIVPEGTDLPDNIPPSRITTISPDGVVTPPQPDAIPRPDEVFEAPADEDTAPPTIVEPFAGAVAQDATATVDSVYTVERGDNLWNIAEEQYGLTSAADVMRAVDHIARMNGLENGTDANRIDIGDRLDMPSAEQITQDVDSLNWTALDAETQANLRAGAPAMDERAAAAPNTLG